MPYAKRTCDSCSRQFEPKSIGDGSTCRGCQRWEKTKGIQASTVATLHIRDCEVCVKKFTAKGDEQRCPECRKLAITAKGADDPPPGEHYLASPLKQVVFDLETFALDRGWGVLMMGCMLVHGDGPEPKWYEFDLTQSKGWPDRRGDDGELAAKIIEVLRGCHVAYAHNGQWFDVPWLNTIALKYGTPPAQIKLIDPVQIARRKYRIGNNGLAAMASYLGLPEQKMPLGAEVWREALFNNDQECWGLLRERCRSDVRVLNMVAGKVTRDVGMIDYSGSAYR